MENQIKIEVPMDLAQAILNYLGKQPLQETYQLFNGIAPLIQVAQLNAQTRKQGKKTAK